MLLKTNGISITLQKKRIKNLILKISPPNAEVKISAPFYYDLEKIKNFINLKFSWILETQKKILSQKYTAPLKFLDGEKHLLFGKEFELKIHKNSSKNLAKINNDILELHLIKHLKIESRKALIETIYRQELKKIIPIIIEKYEKIMDVKVLEFGVKKMKTRWGTCNSKDQRIWLALELAKKPIKCLEMIIVHEMTHLLEKKHNKRFYDFMDKFMPDWKEYDRKLKGSNHF